MKRSIATVMIAASVALLAAAPLWAQQPTTAPRADCKANTPEKVEGQVIAVDMNKAMVTVRASDGKTHQFQATKEMLQTMKPGDRLEAKLREAPRC
jgi:hypothetical protein